MKKGRVAAVLGGVMTLVGGLLLTDSKEMPWLFVVVGFIWNAIASTAAFVWNWLRADTGLEWWGLILVIVAVAIASSVLVAFKLAPPAPTFSPEQIAPRTLTTDEQKVFEALAKLGGWATYQDLHYATQLHSLRIERAVGGLLGETSLALFQKDAFGEPRFRLSNAGVESAIGTGLI